MVDNIVDTARPAGSGERKFFGQPWGLANLFGVELWERFSFYGMQSILAFYLYYSVTDGGLGMSEVQALSIVGAYGGLVYMCSLVASWLSDRILGPERTLLWSAVTVMLGHIILAVLPGYVGLSLGLVLIALGSGGVKTSAQVVLGQLYSREDPRRDAGFSIFYMGINIGGLLGPWLTGLAFAMGGFHWGFGVAAIGMAIGLIQYLAMRKTTIQDAGHHVPNPLPQSDYWKWGVGAVALVVVIVVLIATGVVRVEWLSTITAAIAIVAMVVLLVQMYNSNLTTPVEKSRLLGYIPLLVGGIAFFAIFQSQFTVLAVYSDQRLDRSFFGIELGPGQVQSFNPIFIILFAGVFAGLWTKLGERQWSSPMKFGVANMIIGVSLFFFIPFAGGGPNSTPLWVIVWILFLFTMGELLLSPVGNSLATKVAPVAFESRLFAVWLMAVSAGTALSGTLGGFYDPSSAEAETQFFITTGVAAIVIGIVLIAMRKWVLTKFVDVR
ncbi:Di-/tripeptide transporter [Corynebacterium cystitidis DSM 20524]|nr:peptide MFS transporter [Corynebacterium cystitidis]WJY82256.1 Di-/tripeptide transporter [Corynebacterium cystitidis DSM 20524]SNV77219.1 tripeptide transporter [Corynebacterium cystitidis]